MQPNDPLLLAGGGGTGMAAPPTQEWLVPGSLEWRSGGDSALSRNKLLATDRARRWEKDTVAWEDVLKRCSGTAALQSLSLSLGASELSLDSK